MNGKIPNRIEEGPRFQISHSRSGRSEILGQTLAQIAGLTDINDPIEAIPHQVDPWLVRHLMKLRAHVRLFLV